jgi:hypothetical protein
MLSIGISFYLSSSSISDCGPLQQHLSSCPYHIVAFGQTYIVISTALKCLLEYVCEYALQFWHVSFPLLNYLKLCSVLN